MFKFCNEPNDDGICPPKAFPPSCSSVRKLSCDRKLGTPPVNRFSCKINRDKAVRFAILGGIEPFKELKPMSKTKSSMHFEISGGSWPYKLLWERFKTSRCCRFPISRGIGPKSLFPDQLIIVRFTQLPTVLGILPFKLFRLKSA
ncbi:hypothetical protein KSP40_PGU016500 [Platanthera guangdongensis]|uniref:Uncharacterized protein n=1 Tax=Platanthera guangdongensis TaxID=2320717 RepID=A0ABR2MWM6_9ASPA